MPNKLYSGIFCGVESSTKTRESMSMYNAIVYDRFVSSSSLTDFSFHLKNNETKIYEKVIT